MKGLGNNQAVEEVIDEQEKQPFLERLKSLRDRLKLGPHHTMERFTIMMGASVAFLLLFTVLSFTTYRMDVSQNASAQAIYTEDFNFSLTNQKMYVDGIYGSKDKKDVMVLLRMQDPKAMSSDAKNYQLFVTGEKGELRNPPNVSFSLFGSTGYGIIRFQSNEPIEKGIVDITIRANAELSGRDGAGTSGDESTSDSSFSKYDQGRLFVNPGAEDVKTFDWLKSGEKDPTKLYTALVADAKDKEIHEEIQKQTDELSKLLNQEKEYTNRLESSGYTAPKQPWFIKGDYVNDKGVFVAANDLDRAHKFDYSTKSIRDGYINQVMNGMSEYDEYMAKHSDRNVNAVDNKKNAKSEDMDRIEKLKHSDGSTLDLNTVSDGTSPSVQVAAKDSATALESTWRTYVTEKSKLQRDLMGQLLVLDADVLSQTSSFSTQSDKKAILFY